jgi:esterase/lipase superfamily enzyme
LVEATVRAPEAPTLFPVVLRRTELARFGRGPADLEVRNGVPTPTADVLRREEDLRGRLSAELRRRLAAADRRDVYVFVHGFNNGFDEVATRLAALWHAAGRPSVPLAYTWPAGTTVFGYFYDRESGEFTVRHLKTVLSFLAADPAVARVHLVAHSRGADVAVDALRELHLAETAAGRSTRESLKLATLVLAAPDLDAEIFDQRFLKERVFLAADRTVIYFNRADGAISAASVLFGSGKRLGGLRVEDLDAESQAMLGSLTSLEFVECAVAGRAGGHDYVFRDPSALSDLALVLREGAAAGSPSRPLERVAAGFWRLSNDYLRPADEAPPPLPFGRARVDY